MTRRFAPFILAFSIGVAAIAVPVPGHAQPLLQEKYFQPPNLSPPQRGELRGSLTRRDMAADDLVRGAFALAWPVELPRSRGAPLLNFLPSYSQDNGLSSWGLGWAPRHQLIRARRQGEIRFDQDDEWNSPWGALIRGDDGSYYPRGMQQFIRLRVRGPDLEASAVDGTVYVFSTTDAEGGPRGVHTWNLSSARSLAGRQMQLTYAVAGDGERYLTRVDYGGFDVPQVRCTFHYAFLQNSLLRYRAGKATHLDRRVSRLQVENRQPDGRFSEVWNLELQHEFDPVGPGFTLASVTQVFPGGYAEPPVVYRYGAWLAPLRETKRRPNHALQGYLDDLSLPRGGTLGPAGVTLVDPDRAGQLSLEQAHDVSLWALHKGRFVRRPPVTEAPDASPLCQRTPSLLNPPRLLVHLQGEDEQPRALRIDTVGSISEVSICSLDGRLVSQQQLDGRWHLDVNTRLVDLDRDERPDLIRVFPGAVQIRRNISSANAYRFDRAITQSLSPEVLPQASWVQDHNGDGYADLVVWTADGIWVWHGRGAGSFDPKGSFLPLLRGNQVVTLAAYDTLHFVDANHDGLEDLVVLQSGRLPQLFINRGDSYAFVSVPAFDAVSEAVSQLAVANLSGSGNAELTFTDARGAWSLALDDARTGLLTEVNDGKGTRWRFEYGRPAAQAGIGQRPPVLVAQHVHIAGRLPSTQKFSYGEAAVDPQGRRLWGFTHVQAEGDTALRRVNYLLAEDAPGLMVQTTQSDRRQPNLVRKRQRHYRSEHYAGIDYRQLVEEHEAMAGIAANASETSLGHRRFFSDYVHPFCPLTEKLETASGTLLHRRTLAALVNLHDVPHCLIQNESWHGRHADQELDFDLQSRIGRESTGQITFIEHGAQRLQTVTYDAYHRPIAVTTPASGTLRLAYAPQSGLLREVLRPEGLVAEAHYDPLTDQLLQLVNRRGNISWTRFFSYDAGQRLAAAWDNLYGGSEQRPTQSYSTVYATATRPGLSGMTLAYGPNSHARQLDLHDGAGALLGQAFGIDDDSWILPEIQRSDPARGETTGWRRKNALLSVLPSQWSYEELFAELIPKAREKISALQQPIEEARRIGEKLWRQQTTQVQLNTTLRHTMELSGGPTRQKEYDSAGRLVAETDPLGHISRFRYDVLGRLRRMHLADSALHRVDYDALGRLIRSHRQGVRCLSQAYEADTGRLACSTHGDGNCRPLRQDHFDYDELGRLRVQRHVDLSTGKEKKYEHLYDGQQADGSWVDGELGLRTATVGPDFQKSWSHFPDGTLRRRKIRFADWRVLEERFSRWPDSSVRQIERQVTDVASGYQVQKQRVEYGRDSSGRANGIKLDGAQVETLHYDERGRLAQIRLPDGADLSFHFDPISDWLVGKSLKTARADADYHVGYDSRGQIISMRLWHGSNLCSASFDYDARQFLAEVKGRKNYLYDGGGRRLLSEVRSKYDAEGRLREIGDARLLWGPDGELESAKPSRSSPEVHYTYDDQKQRILEWRGGKIELARAEDTTLTGDGLVSLVRVADVPVGTLIDHGVELLLTDTVGTVLQTPDGETEVPAPFGERRAPLPGATAVDFGGRPRSASLPLVRMGTRDYAPSLGEFTTPDSLLFEEPERCVVAPEQCNLYSYAANDPLALHDFSGQFVAPAARAAVSVYRLGVALAGYAAYRVHDAQLNGQRDNPLQAAERHTQEALSHLDAHAEGDAMEPVPAAGGAGAGNGWFGCNLPPWLQPSGTDELGRQATDVLAHEYYKIWLRAAMEAPRVHDAQLSNLLDNLYRPSAQVGSGSTAAAVRYESRTGEPVMGRNHMQKATEQAKRLEKWINAHPTAHPGDRSAAENMLKDLCNAMGGR